MRDNNRIEEYLDELEPEINNRFSKYDDLIKTGNPEEEINSDNFNNKSGIARFEVDEGTAADVAYLLWESEGTVTANNIWSMSQKEEYSAVDSLSLQDAREGLQAVAAIGLTQIESPETNDFAYGIDGFNTEESFSFQQDEKNAENEVDSMMDKVETYMDELDKNEFMEPRRYRAGDRQQFSGFGKKISDPQEAFQKIGSGFQGLEFEVSPYLKIENEILDD